MASETKSIFERAVTKTGRLLSLYILASVVIGILGLCWLELPIAGAIVWHMRNRGPLVVEGHSFEVPLLSTYKLEHYREWQISTADDLFVHAGSVSIKQTGETLNSGAADAWQTTKISDLNRLLRTHNLRAQTIKGRQLEFVCIRDTWLVGDESFHCRVPNTDLYVDVNGGENMRRILETSQ